MYLCMKNKLSLAIFLSKTMRIVNSFQIVTSILEPWQIETAGHLEKEIDECHFYSCILSSILAYGQVTLKASVPVRSPKLEQRWLCPLLNMGDHLEMGPVCQTILNKQQLGSFVINLIFLHVLGDIHIDCWNFRKLTFIAVFNDRIYLWRCSWSNSYRRRWTSATGVQILDEVVCIPHSTNPLRKGMNPFVLSAITVTTTSYNKYWVDWTL